LYAESRDMLIIKYGLFNNVKNKGEVQKCPKWCVSHIDPYEMQYWFVGVPDRGKYLQIMYSNCPIFSWEHVVSLDLEIYMVKATKKMGSNYILSQTQIVHILRSKSVVN
jgi:hypothetical protein